jgi:hypothetical protein
MSEEHNNPQFDWAEQLFANKYDVSPKYRDMLAMLASSMMGSPDAAEHFFNQAKADGASEEELARVASFMRMSLEDIGNFADLVPPSDIPGEFKSMKDSEGGAESSEPK